MVHVFTDGRILFQDNLLRDSDKGRYISVHALPEVETGEDRDVMFFANLKKGTVEYRIIDPAAGYENATADADAHTHADADAEESPAGEKQPGKKKD